MKTIFKTALGIFLISFLVQCTPLQSIPTDAVATIVEEGFIDCYEEGLLNEEGKPLWCETSAVLKQGDRIYFGKDHQMPDERSAVFSMAWKNGKLTGEPTYEMKKLLKEGVKYEDFAVSPDGKWVFLITGFDRVMLDGSSGWDGYNGLFYWPAGAIEKVRAVSKNGKDDNSVSLREDLSEVLKNEDFPKGMPYFKTEGLAVLKDRMLLGIREYGKDYNDFSYSVKILSVSYKEENGRIQLKNDFKVLADMDIKKLTPSIKETLALSSIEYDVQNDRFYLLTSFEDEDHGIGAYLWIASLRDLQAGLMHPVKDADGNPLRFDHKAEDLTIIGKNKLFLIHDDDKEVTTVNGVARKPHQAAYSIVELR